MLKTSRKKESREREGVFVYDSFYGMIEYTHGEREYLFQVLHEIITYSVFKF